MKRLIFTSLILFGIFVFTIFTFNYTQASNFQTNGVNNNHTTIRSADDPGAPWTSGGGDSNGGIPGAWGHGGPGGGGSRFFHYCNTNSKKNY